MSGAINGYVFPPPIPPSNVTARFLAGRSDQIFMPQRLPSPCQGPNPPEPSINWQNQLLPHDPNVFNPFVRLPTQFNARMQSLNNREFNWLPRGLQHQGGDSSSELEVGTKAHFCEPCEKEFKTEFDKMAHIKQHIKCEVEGCNFVASRKTIKLHFIQCHEVGKFKIVLKNEQDIKKWREERKRNFPCLSRRLDRLKEEDARNKQGNVLKKREFRYKGSGTWQRKNLNQSQNFVASEQNNNVKQLNQKGMSPKESVTLKVVRNSNEESSVQKMKTKNTSEKNEIKNANGLQSLNLMYGSSESEESDEEEDDEKDRALKAYKQKLLDSIDAEIFKKEEDKRQLNVKEVDNIKMEVYNEKNVGFENDQQDLSRINSTEDSLNCDSFQSSNGNKSNEVEERFIKQKQRDDLLVENSQQVSTRKTSFEHGRKRRLNERRTMESRKAKRPGKHNRPTLLEMLLANDIKHERNVILQCIRYIAKNNLLNVH